MSSSRMLTGALAVFMAALALAPAAAARVPGLAARMPGVRVLRFHYRAHDGLLRGAYLVLPPSYAPGKNPPIPLVISPHGRGVDARANMRLWGDLPARGAFAVVNPEGQGRRLELFSWGDPGQIADLARMPRLVERAFPWVRIDRRRIYAIGGSMGGQETLLLVARHPRLLAGAAAFDAPTDMVMRYRDFPLIRYGRGLQALARYEIGGPPSANEGAYDARSPLDAARRIAFSGVPLQLWWSSADRIVVDQRRQSGLLFREIERLNPGAPVVQVTGSWRHTAEMRSTRRLPEALAAFGLLPGYAPPPWARPLFTHRSRSSPPAALRSA